MNRRNKTKHPKKYAYTLSSARYSRYKSLQAVNKEGKFNKQPRTSIIHSSFFIQQKKKKPKRNWFEKKVTTCWSKHYGCAWIYFCLLLAFILQNSYIRSKLEPLTVRVKSGIPVFSSNKSKRYFYWEKYMTFSH